MSDLEQAPDTSWVKTVEIKDFDAQQDELPDIIQVIPGLITKRDSVGPPILAILAAMWLIFWGVYAILKAVS